MQPPRWIRNNIDGTARSLWPLQADHLIAQARRRTGLCDFGEPSIEPGFSILLHSLEQEANLHPMGRFLLSVHLRTLLETRLQLHESWKNEAGEALPPIEQPVFIVGMPRSGSTFLHELLAADPQNRAPEVWEVMFPVDNSAAAPDSSEQRIRKTEFCLWWFRRLAPRADAVYPMRAHTPHECVAIHSYTLLSEEFISTCRIPAYEEFLHSTDLMPVYLWQKRFLQHLQNGSEPQRWVLKSPDHVYALEELFKVFPDACIIQTHRNPVEVLKSSADLTRVLRALYGRPEPAEEIRAREARVLAEGTDRFIQFRDTHPELADRFIDVKYTQLIAQPVSTVRWIYRQLHRPFPDETARRMQQIASKRSQYRGRRASAHPAGGSLANPLEIALFERYCSRFELSFGETHLRR